MTPVVPRLPVLQVRLSATNRSVLDTRRARRLPGYERERASPGAAGRSQPPAEGSPGPPRRVLAGRGVLLAAVAETRRPVMPERARREREPRVVANERG